MKKLKKFAALLLVGVMAPDQSGEGRPGDQ